MDPSAPSPPPPPPSEPGGPLLSNCPFCGEEPWDGLLEFDNKLRVICSECGALGPGVSDKDEAVAQWNLRVEG